jgi:hypothetical protein
MQHGDMVQVRRSGGHDYGAPKLRIGRSQFKRDHTHKTAFDVGDLVPYFVDEVLPGDTFTCKLNSFIRILSPLDAPIMDNIEVDIDFFFVPNRLLWNNWEAFLGAHDAAGAQDTDYTIPKINTGTFSDDRRIANYMGIPLGADAADNDVSALPFRAYRLIYNEWYRDQNLIDELVIDLGNGPDSISTTQTALKSAKKHDYFTSCLPYLQKGTAQSLPFTDAPVLGIGALDQSPSLTPGPVYETDQPSTTTYSQAYASTEMVFEATAPANAFPAIYADLSSVSVTINQLREATAIQRLLERDARGGTRHPELIRAHFGVTVPDYRTQRPEYLGGGSGYINVSPIANTTSTGTQGDLAAIGTGTLRASWAKSFVEHGFVLGILRARGDLTYFQGLDRMWSRSTKYDFYWPELANLGEQPVLNKEIYISGTAADDAVFGYQERYAEYRHKKSLVTGRFNPDAGGSLSFWHLAEDFASLPSLNQTFIEDATPMSRVIAVADRDFIIDGYFELRCARPIPVRPTPSLMPLRF